MESLGHLFQSGQIKDPSVLTGKLVIDNRYDCCVEHTISGVETGRVCAGCQSNCVPRIMTWIKLDGVFAKVYLCSPWSNELMIDPKELVVSYKYKELK